MGPEKPGRRGGRQAATVPTPRGGRWAAVAGFVAAAAAALLAAATHAYVYACPDLPGVRDSVVVLTGASSGIGAELAVQYGRLGARLVLAARRERELGAVAAAARAAGASAVLAVPTDLTDPAACEALVAAALAAFPGGRIDTLFLNAAFADEGLFVGHNSSASLGDALTRTFATNVLGSAYVARAALPALEAAGGHIAVVSSASSKVPAPFHPGYTASKNALNGLFDTLQAELHLLRSSVTVGVQVLGMIGTPEVLRDPALAGLAAPVPAVAAEMICASRARWRQAYVPKWYALWTAATTLGGSDFAEWAMNSAYIWKVPRYVADIERYRLDRRRGGVGDDDNDVSGGAAASG
jgi:NAD(P)-dependent dehydrogenase (short-subunit alcohol dehydrogenase family)